MPKGWLCPGPLRLLSSTPALPGCPDIAPVAGRALDGARSVAWVERWALPMSSVALLHIATADLNGRNQLLQQLISQHHSCMKAMLCHPAQGAGGGRMHAVWATCSSYSVVWPVVFRPATAGPPTGAPCGAGGWPAACSPRPSGQASRRRWRACRAAAAALAHSTARPRHARTTSPAARAARPRTCPARSWTLTARRPTTRPPAPAAPPRRGRPAGPPLRGPG